MGTIIRLAIVVVVIGFVAHLSREAAAGYWGMDMELSWPKAIFLAPLQVVVFIVGTIALKVSPSLVAWTLELMFAHAIASTIAIAVLAISCWGVVIGFIAGDR